MLKHGEPVWFGCDVGKMLDRDLGILDLELYDYESVYGVRFGMDKATRLDYGESQMNHAMVFAGVDLDERGKPTKWRVENSWGEKGEGKGFLTMSDRWFDEFVYEVAVDKKHVPQELLRPLLKDPVHLPPWDPMGALAK
jgi:bleomycin hydrolase